MRIGYLECFSGISGDMLLGALVDAGVPFELLEKTTAALNVGAHLESRKVMRGGLAATKIDVVVEGSESAHGHEHEHSHPHDHEPHSHEHPHEHTHETHAHAEHSHSEPHAHKQEHAHAAHRPLSAILGIIAAAP